MAEQKTSETLTAILLFSISGDVIALISSETYDTVNHSFTFCWRATEEDIRSHVTSTDD